MRLKEWSKLPDKMRTKEVRKYYNILIKHSGWFKFKRIMDIFVASVMLIVLALPMAVIAVFIKADSKGPVLFKQKRVTQYGRIFEIYKFRTMVENAASIGSQVTVKNDVRITKVGKVLRKFRIDEFPQVFNIIRGDMTLVGTRPEVIKYVQCYTPQMYATLLLPAGLTSRTSIAYKDEEKLLSNASNADKVYIHDILPVKMKYNLESLKHFGFKEDCSILWATFLSVFKKES
ncbi:MAG: sugar transferase [Lachnospira sp.]|jgi:lipopolysaccharide/colanic/teichoic acid biosynthesis glycosyltransferase|nr:sugar transferase [Lachnospira sp.]